MSEKNHQGYTSWTTPFNNPIHKFQFINEKVPSSVGNKTEKLRISFAVFRFDHLETRTP